MSRKKLSEFRAKTVLYQALGQPYNGMEVDAQDTIWEDRIRNLDAGRTYVVKVDQAEKGRFKKGLVKLDRQVSQLSEDIRELFSQGFRFALVEEYRRHEPSEEHYLTLERLREGNKLSFSNFGGIDIEAHRQEIFSQFYTGGAVNGLAVEGATLEMLAKVFEENYFSFLEINPFTIENGMLRILDAAVEVDDEATFFEEGWQAADIRRPRAGAVSEEELAVQALNVNSQASFSLERINADGGIWLLLSGGGASVVVADEVYNLGYGKQLGNYGEYSGNPNTEETRHYTEQVLRLLLRSQAPRKVLIIGGGVANFTDVRQTFKGVIEALDKHLPYLKQQEVGVYVRRGGPHEKEGLELMKAYLDEAGLHNQVAGPELLLSDIVGQAVQVVGVPDAQS